MGKIWGKIGMILARGYTCIVGGKPGPAVVRFYDRAPPMGPPQNILTSIRNTGLSPATVTGYDDDSTSSYIDTDSADRQPIVGFFSDCAGGIGPGHLGD